MLKLEKLYDCAQKYLISKSPDWKDFAIDFEENFQSKMALYSPSINANEGRLYTTTSPQIMEQYFADKIYEFDAILADHPNPLEPTRRTEAMNDEEFYEYPAAKKFLLKNGVFYIMVVYAILADGSYLILFVWRNENEKDFSDIEKQRLALFMRYLSALIAPIKTTSLSKPDKEVNEFGKKYSLTQTEIEILSYLLNGESLREIANKGESSYSTVRWHVRNILNKCHVNSQKTLLSEFYTLIKR